jgi:Ca-activated chloride channel family protein
MIIRIGASMAASLLLCFVTPLLGQKPPQMQPPVIRVGEDGVFVRVLVTDTLNRYIAGLGKEHFRIYENGVQQTIHYFTQQSAPIGIGIVFDLACSMNGQADADTLALSQIVQAGQAGDEYFLISFDEKTAHFQEAGGNPPAQEDIVFSKLPAPRQPPLHGAIAMGLDRLKKGANEKKALIIISDREIRSSLPAIQVYAISGYASWNYWGTKAPASAGTSGVRTFLPSSHSEMDYYIRLIQDELKNQYVLGYVPTNKNRDGKWRKIEVKLNAPKHLPQMVVVAVQGYTAPGK